MPVFGKTLFETVLETMESADIDHDEVVPPNTRVPSVRAFILGTVDDTSRDAENASSFIHDDYRSGPENEERSEPCWLGRLSNGQIAEDLDLENCNTVALLRDRRRTFALENHPDRVGNEFRDQATLRMTVANQMIDAAMERLPKL